MKLALTVLDAAGNPLKAGKALLSAVDASGRMVPILDGAINLGELTGELDPAKLGLQAISTAGATPSSKAATAETSKAATAETSRAATAETSRATSEAQPAAPLSTTSRTLSISDVVAGTGAQIDDARTSVSSLGVSVGEVRLTVRGAATTTEAGAVALDLGASGTTDTLSTLEASYHPSTPSGTGAPTGGATLPSLIGYTPTMAERKLAALGLGARLASISVASAAEIGRVARTLPAAGQAVAPGSTVRLFIGRA
jgi:hypothetical protein